MLSGTAQTLIQRGEHLEWLDVGPGDFIHIPGGAKHAHRNVSTQPVVELVTTTPELGRFFQEIGQPVTVGVPQAPPTREQLLHFERMARKYHHWLASPEENAAVGLTLPWLAEVP